MRNPYRPLASDAIVTAGSANFRGMVHACHPGRAVVAFAGSHPPAFALSHTLGLVLTGGQLSAPLKCEAEVVERVDGRDDRRYTFRFQEGLFNLVLPQSAIGERRQWTRVSPPVSLDVPIEVTPISTTGRIRGRLVRAGLLADISAGGLGVFLEGHQEGPLTGHDRVRVEFTPPGTQVQLMRECRIRSRVLAEDQIRLGLQFHDWESKLVFEPIWACSECDEEGLMEFAHTHCCGCGLARSSPTRLPGWDALVPREEHRFFGRARVCGACGGHWAEAAQHCGLCGTQL